MACTELTRCDNSLAPASHDIVLDNSGLVDYDACTIDGIGLGNLPSSTNTAENLCKRLRGIKALRGDRKWKNKAKRAEKDKLDDVEEDLCDKLKELYVEPESTSSGEVAPQEETPVYGCKDPAADNYWCKVKGNNCVNNEVPEGVIDINCEYSRELAVDNKYLFCNNKNGCGTQDTTAEGWVTPTTDIATWINNGAIDNDHIFQVKAGMKKLIEKIAPNYLFLKNKKGFYTHKFPSHLVEELSNALTVAIFKTKFKKGESNNTFPFTRVTVYSTDSQPLGQFKIVPKTGKNGEVDSINDINSHTSSWHLRKRLSNEVGTEILDPSRESKYNEVLKAWNIPGYTFKDGKLIRESVNEGLGLLLQKEPIGLAQLLK